MPNYQNAKIYLLKSPNHDKVYVGSTVQTLKERFRCHKSTYNCWKNGSIKQKMMSFDILEKGDATIELIMEYPCQTKQELFWKEREITEQYNSINSHKQIATEEEKKKQAKENDKKQYIRVKNDPIKLQKRAEYKQKWRQTERGRELLLANDRKLKEQQRNCPITCLTCRVEYKNLLSFREHYRRKHRII